MRLPVPRLCAADSALGGITGYRMAVLVTDLIYSLFSPPGFRSYSVSSYLSYLPHLTSSSVTHLGDYLKLNFNSD